MHRDCARGQVARPDGGQQHLSRPAGGESRSDKLAASRLRPIRVERLRHFPQAANVTSGRVTEKETKSFAFDRSYWFVDFRPLLA